MAEEHVYRHTNALKVLAYFRQHPGEWVSTQTLEHLGGRHAWRTRVSQARKIVQAEGGQIKNRQSRVYRHPPATDVWFMVSEYRFMPWTPVGRPADEYREPRLFT